VLFVGGAIDVFVEAINVFVGGEEEDDDDEEEEGEEKRW